MIGYYLEKREGLHQIISYGYFVKGFASNKQTAKHRHLVHLFLRDESIPAFLFRRMKDRYPEQFRAVIRNTVLPLKKNFDPVNDFVLLMDRYKPEWRVVYPSVHPLNERFRKYFYHEQKIGRNDLCPCQSAKKFKRCCGL